MSEVGPAVEYCFVLYCVNRTTHPNIYRQQRRKDQKLNIIPVISLPNTSIHQPAVILHSEYALVAVSAVVGAGGFDEFTDFAEGAAGEQVRELAELE